MISVSSYDSQGDFYLSPFLNRSTKGIIEIKAPIRGWLNPRVLLRERANFRGCAARVSIEFENEITLTADDIVLCFLMVFSSTLPRCLTAVPAAFHSTVSDSVSISDSSIQSVILNSNRLEEIRISLLPSIIIVLTNLALRALWTLDTRTLLWWFSFELLDRCICRC